MKMFQAKFGRPWMLVISFVASSIGATFVNKYVLSVLKFTYPTVYQSWQMGIAFGITMSASSLGFVQLSSIDRSSLRNWLPAMCVFTLGIYSGSKALSRLPVPIFCTMFHLVHTVIAVVDGIFFKQASSFAWAGIFTGAAGMVLTIKNDNEFDIHSYKWIFIHCFCSAIYSLYAKRIHTVQLKEIDKIAYNSSFSLVVLMLIGTFTGEVNQSTEFPFLYYNKFHAGCIASGIVGALLCLSYSGLTGIMPVSKIRWLSSISMVLMSMLSLALFDFTLSMYLALSITLGLTGSVVYTYSVYVSDTRLETESEDLRTTKPSAKL